MLRRLIESHRGTEFSHRIVSLTDAGELGESLRASGVEVQSLGMSGLVNAPIALLRLTKLIRSGKPDIVQTWMYHADLMGGLAARSVGNANVIWGIRNTDMMRGTAYSTFAIRRMCALLSRILPAKIVCAADASRRSHAAIGYDDSKMVVIANGFDKIGSTQIAADRNLIRGACAWTDDEVIVGCVGRFNYYKDHTNFAMAAGLLARRFSSVRIVMIGKGLDAENKELNSVIAATGFASRFRLLGFRKDVLKWLSALDVFCLSSRSEGFPNVVGEAMSVGIPCVATDVGDVRALLSNTGIVVPKENAQALYEGLAQVVAMPRPLRAALGQQGRARIIQEFSMARVTDKLETLYRSVAARASR